MRVVKTKNIADIQITCDFCQLPTSYFCYICEKDCCHNCGRVFTEDSFDDYPRWLCGKCHEIGIPFLRDMEILRENLDISLQDLLQKWRDCAKV